LEPAAHARHFHPLVSGSQAHDSLLVLMMLRTARTAIGKQTT
jgi:hypothetical protein